MTASLHPVADRTPRPPGPDAGPLPPDRPGRPAHTGHPGHPGHPGRARRALLALGLAAPLALAGCASPQVQDHAADRPLLDLRQYFNGELLAHGLVTDRNGRVRQRFTVRMTGRWQGDSGTLDERFTYADGRTEQRIWQLQRLADGRWQGRAPDVVGEALGESAGNALNWRYTLRLPVDGRSWDIDFDDWMFLVDERVMINRAVMSKFGIRLGEVLLSFQRLPG